MFRSFSGIFSAFLLPIIAIFCMNHAIGGNVTGMVLGVVNNEVAHIDECFNSSLVTARKHDFDCTLRKVSCRFIDQIDDSVAVKVRSLEVV